MQSFTPTTKISHLTLLIRNAQISLDFYRNRLGMTLIEEQVQKMNGQQENHYFLAFIDPDEEPNREEIYTSPITMLELIETQKAFDNTRPGVGYWKIGVTLPHVDFARQRLIDQGIHVTQPRQFLDVGYLCHLQDPDGYTIELLQHTFEENHGPEKPSPIYPLASRPTLGQITLRVKDADSSLKFYREQLGMKLLSRQIIEPYGFTLYFLGCADESLPVDNIDSVENREWLWQRPYTTLELQYIWKNEKTDCEYCCEIKSGFDSLSFTLVESVEELRSRAGAAKSNFKDSDGYKIHCY